MNGENKSQEDILKKLGIEKLNPMQEEAFVAICTNPEVVLLSPTGTGKTLAFLLPIISELDSGLNQVQAMILVPSRELAIQIEQVIREMGSGFKALAVYGGRTGAKDRIDLKHPPAILIGTPGRIADHIRRQSVFLEEIKTLVLDEFDKSLEVGFEKEMREILKALPLVKKKILTSATKRVEIPAFIGIKEPKELDFLAEKPDLLSLKTIETSDKDKLESLQKLLGHIGVASGIVFCNLKESIKIVSDFLNRNHIKHACFYGGLEQKDRERALIKFRNGTHNLLLATDLAARGIDVPAMDFIIHYELPPRKTEFVHRNGRTARMHNHGTAYILKWKNEALPEFIEGSEIIELEDNQIVDSVNWATLFVSGGRKDKISKGDLVGLFLKQGGLLKEELGAIELKQDCAFVAVAIDKSEEIVEKLNNSKLKKKKVRISILN